MSEDPNATNLTLRIEWNIYPSEVEALKAHAVKVDDENLGEHQSEYTVEQALTVVFHGDPKFLFDKGVLFGWVVQDDVGWGKDAAGNSIEIIETEEERA